MANSVIQTIRDAEVDARSLSEFISKSAYFTVTRRLAPTIHTLDYYLLVLNKVKDKGDLADMAISDTLDKLEQLEPTVIQRVEDAINNTAVEGGVLADTFVVVDGSLSQRTINKGLESIADLSTIKNPKDGLRVYVKSYHAGQGKGGGVFIYREIESLDNGVTIFNSSSTGKFIRVDKSKITLYDCGCLDTGTAVAESNSLYYNNAYEFFKSYGATVYVPVGWFSFSEPVVVSGFYLKGLDELNSKCAIQLIQPNPSSLLGTVSYGYWGTVDYTKIIAPIIVTGAYYAGVSGVRVNTSSLRSTQVTHGVFDSISRYHSFDNLMITAQSQKAFETLGGFLSNYGSMDISGPKEGVFVGPGPANQGGNSPNFGDLWIKGVEGYAFYASGMTEMVIDRLYVEDITEMSSLTSLVYLWTTRNAYIGSLYFDKVRVNVESLLKIRAATGAIINNISLAAISTPDPVPLLGLNGTSRLTLNSLSSSGTLNVYLAKELLTGNGNITFGAGFYLPGSIENNLNSAGGVFKNAFKTKNSLSTITSTNSLTSFQVLHFKKDRASTITVFIDLLSQASVSGGGFRGRKYITVDIAPDDTITMKEDSHVLYPTSVVSASCTVVQSSLDESLSALAIGQPNTAYGRIKIDVDAVSRGGGILNTNDF